MQVSNNPFMLIFGAIQILLSQIPDFDRLWFLSILAAVMSISYSTIGLGLAIGKTTGNLAQPCSPFTPLPSSRLTLLACLRVRNGAPYMHLLYSQTFEKAPTLHSLFQLMSDQLSVRHTGALCDTTEASQTTKMITSFTCQCQGRPSLVKRAKSCRALVVAK